MSEAEVASKAPACPQCGTQIAAGLLCCPGCGGLVHADELKRLAKSARLAGDAQRPREALTLWREALEFLPPGSRQHAQIGERIAELSDRVDQQPASATDTNAPAASASSAPRFGWKKGLAGAGALGLLFWKFKFVLTFLLTKGKLLILGLTKGSTFFSMILSLGVYWTAFGWKFALGLVISIYIHEMGHVAALRRFGIKATAPMFIPGLGAVVRLKQYPATPREDARVGLAGPIWGLAAAVGAYLVALATGWPSWAAIARVGAWINLFNLLPFWQLDGGRGFRALARKQRWAAAGVIAVAFILTSEGLLILLLIAALAKALSKSAPADSDRTAFWQYVLLVIALSFLSLIDVPGLAEA